MNPFGLDIGTPAGMTSRKPRQVAPAPVPFGFPAPKSKMEQTADILKPYVTGPVDAFWGLMNSPFALGFAPTEQDAANGLAAGGGAMMAGSIVPKPANALNMGIKAFHGSPHDFDRFDMSKIGTGEGAQAYGHGLYFADSENVAKSYRDNLLGRGTIMSGKADNLPDRWQMLVYEAMKKPAGEIRDNAIQALRAKVPAEYADQVNALLNNKGSMYEVNIDADPNAFLDWDKPINEQAQNVKDAISPWFLPDGKEVAGSAVQYLQKYKGGPVKIAEQLKERGIPGIKYLDAGSRGPATIYNVGSPKDGFGPYTPFTNQADAEKHVAMLKRQGFPDAEIRIQEQPQSRNYVVFDDKLISIVRKYGIAGASAMLGYNILDGMDDAQAAELKKIEGNQ